MHVLQRLWEYNKAYKNGGMSNRDCGDTRRYTEKGHACLTETVGIQEATQRKGHACLTETVGIQEGIQKRGMHV